MLGTRYGHVGTRFSLDSRVPIFNSRDPNRAPKTPLKNPGLDIKIIKLDHTLLRLRKASAFDLYKEISSRHTLTRVQSFLQRLKTLGCVWRFSSSVSRAATFSQGSLDPSKK